MRSLSFLASFCGSGPSGRQGPPKDPKLTILSPKMYPQSSQNGAQETPRATQSGSKHYFKIDRCLKAEFEPYRVNPKKIYVKEVLRRCSAQRAQSAAAPPVGAVGRVRYVVLCQSLSSVIIRTSLSPASAADPTPAILQKSSFFPPWFLVDFLSQDGAKTDHTWRTKPDQNRSKIGLIFWSIFWCDFDPKMVSKMTPRTTTNHSKINPEPHLVWKTWFSEK